MIQYINWNTPPFFFFFTTHTMGPMLGPIPPLKWGHQCEPNGLFVGWSHLHRFINWNTFFFLPKLTPWAQHSHAQSNLLNEVTNVTWMIFYRIREQTSLNLGLGGKIQKVHQHCCMKPFNIYYSKLENRYKYLTPIYR